MGDTMTMTHEQTASAKKCFDSSLMQSAEMSGVLALIQE